MLIHEIEYHAPTELEDLLNLLHHYGDDAKLLAGGTDLIVQLKLKKWNQRHIIDVKQVKGLNKINKRDDHYVIGCNTTLSELLKMPDIKQNYRALWDSINELADRQIRNRGTLVGNLCNASPAADTPPPLLTYQAQLRVQSIKKDKMVPVKDFFVGPGKTVLNADEMVTEIHIPIPPPRTYCAFQKIGRVYDDIAILNASVQLQFDASLTCTSASIAMGAVGPTVGQAHKAEEMLIGQKLNQDLIRNAARQAAQESSPISDVRASEKYRRTTIQVIVERALMDVFQKLQS